MHAFEGEAGADVIKTAAANLCHCRQGENGQSSKDKGDERTTACARVRVIQVKPPIGFYIFVLSADGSVRTVWAGAALSVVMHGLSAHCY